MGFLFLILAKITAIIKMSAMKCCGRISTGTNGSVKINLIRSVGCLLVSIFICTLSGFESMEYKVLFIAVLSGISNGLLLCSWVIAAEKVSLAAVETFSMIGGVLFPMLLSFFLPTESAPGLLSILGAVILIFASYLFLPISNKEKLSPTLIPLLILVAFSNCGCVLSQKLFSSYGGTSVATFNLLTFAFCTLILSLTAICMSVRKRPVRQKNGSVFLTKEAIIYILLAIVMLYASQYFQTVSASFFTASIFYPLSYALAMPMTFITDILLFKEKISKRSIFAIILVISSAILIYI